MKRELIMAIVTVLLCMAASAAFGQLPIVASYPSIDSGWSLVGNVSPQNCAGTCKWFLPDTSGVPTVFPRTIGTSDKAEWQLNELIQVQNNGQPSYADLLVNVPAFGYYKISVDVQGLKGNAPLGGQFVSPVMNVVVNAGNVNICQYPNNVAISCNTYLTVNDTHNTLEYATTGSVTLFAGNNHIAIQIAGGQGHGGTLVVRHMLIYLASGITGYAMCVTPPPQTIHDSQLSGTDLFDLQTTANSWNQTTCGPSSGILPAVNLKASYYNPGTGCNNGPCALTEMY